MTEQFPVGRAIREARQAKGLSLRALAGMLDVSPATMSAVENGHTSVTVNRLQRIAELLGVSAARLLRGEGAVVDVPPHPRVGGWRNFEGLALDPILEAATRLFLRQGFHATSMREVAAEAGLSVAGIYHHYSSKQQILLVLLDTTMAEIRWRQQAARNEGATAVESFAFMVESLALFHAVRGDLAFLGASEMRGLSGPDFDRIKALRDEVQYALDEQAAACLEAGDFTTDDPHTACRAIATMCTSLPAWFRLTGLLTPEQVAKRYAAYALALMSA
ncbi:TetR family transcriptional regulator [Streptosporangium sp. NPDC087985]|uniref:TetR family transcriptional regulator n=1 Tax=Streptosporangium sp. NPDC087985 TaxID=3366196 RepID=UPI0038196273